MKIKLTRIWTMALALTFSASLLAAPAPRSMAAIGDSITAGALAGFNRTDGMNPILLPKFLYYIGKIGYMRSLRGMESRGRSWAAGDGSKVLTHARRLKSLNRNLQAYNASVSGATSNNIAEQVSSILQWSKSLGQGAPDYVTIEIGANDACAKSNDEMTSVATYKNNIKSAVYRLLGANRNSRIMIGGVPNLEHLRNVAQDSLLMGVPPAARCKNMWAIHKFCNNVLLEQNPAKRREVSQRLVAYMNAAKEVARDANSEFGADKVRTSLNVYDYKFNDREISMDCFHPNWRGQQALSDVMWKNTWWASQKSRSLTESDAAADLSTIDEPEVADFEILENTANEVLN